MDQTEAAERKGEADSETGQRSQRGAGRAGQRRLPAAFGRHAGSRDQSEANWYEPGQTSRQQRPKTVGR